MINTLTINGFNRFQVVSAIDPNGHKVDQLTNARGQLPRVREYTGTSTYTEYAATTYAYDTLGNLTSVTDAQNNVTSMSYDAFGRKTGMTDPDMGTWSYTYNAVSSLLSQKDARGNQLCFTYDVLNRLLSRTQDSIPTDPCPPTPPTPPTSGSTHLASYTYDSAANGIGQLATVSWGPTLNQNKDTFFYDTLGRMNKQERKIDGRAYLMETTSFDVLNRPLTLKLPSTEIITLTYDREGENTLRAGSDLLVDNFNHYQFLFT